MSQKPVSQSWEPVVLVREEGESTRMLVKLDAEKIRGLTVMTTDGQEAVFVNVMGNLQPQMFNQAVAALSVPAPEVRIEQQETN